MMIKSPHMIWATVAIVITLIAGVVILALAHADTTAILSIVTLVAVPVLGALLYGQMGAVKDNTNGTNHRLLDMVERQTEILSHLQPLDISASKPALDEYHPTERSDSLAA